MNLRFTIHHFRDTMSVSRIREKIGGWYEEESSVYVHRADA